MRIVRAATGAHLFARRLSGGFGFEPGALTVDRSRAVDDAAWRAIEDALASAQFDEIDPLPEIGCDGAMWIVEAVRRGSYRVVERWCPSIDSPDEAYVRACCLFLDLAGEAS